jgi:hypothetical protein
MSATLRLLCDKSQLKAGHGAWEWCGVLAEFHPAMSLNNCHCAAMNATLHNDRPVSLSGLSNFLLARDFAAPVHWLIDG